MAAGESQLGWGLRRGIRFLRSLASCSPREQSPCSGKGKLGLPATAPELLQILLCVPELLSYLTLVES